MRRAWWIPVLLLAAGSAAGCGKRVQPAMGSGSVVALVSSPATRQAAAVLTESLEKDRYMTPRPEKPFMVTSIGIDALKEHYYDKNVIVLCDLSEGGRILKAVRSILSDADRRDLAGGKSAVIFKTDTWGTYQNVVVIAAPNSRELLALVEEQADGITGRLEEATIEIMTRFFSEQGGIPGLRSKIVDRYGWSLLVPEGYVLKTERPEVPLVGFERPAPPRLIYVYWFPGSAEPTVESAIELRKKIAWEQYDQDEIAEGKVRGAKTVLNGGHAVRIEGLWRNAKYTIGGPFITYLVTGPECDRTLMLDLVLYAPGIDQIAYLRELEAIARTLVCCAH